MIYFFLILLVMCFLEKCLFVLKRKIAVKRARKIYNKEMHESAELYRKQWKDSNKYKEFVERDRLFQIAKKEAENSPHGPMMKKDTQFEWFTGIYNRPCVKEEIYKEIVREMHELE